MKRCPACARTFSGGFNFCTDDGSTLVDTEPTVPVKELAPEKVPERPLPTPETSHSHRSRSSQRPRVSDPGPQVSNNSASDAHDKTTKLRIMIGAMVMIGIVLIVLLALAISGGFRPGSDTASESSDVLIDEDESSETFPEESPLLFSDDLDNRVIAFFDRWKSTGEATDQEWASIAGIAAVVSDHLPTDTHAHARHEYARGQVDQRRGEYDRADSWYATASNSWPGWELPINGQGTLAARRRDFAEAARFYRAAIATDPSWLFPRTNLIGALINLNRFNEVESEARQALATHPNSAYAHYALAIAHGRANRLPDAISEAEIALRLDPNGSSGFNPTSLREAISTWRGGPAPVDSPPTTTERGYPRTMRVDAPDDGFLALRSAPSVSNGNRLANIPHGTTISLRSCSDRVLSIEGELGHWCRTTYAGRSGWVFDGFLR